VASTGTVVRFDRRRGYGFVQPDDGGEDVFVHQNNINMEGFRFLQVGERVTYELEVGEKGMKAVSVALVEPRAVRPGGGRDDEFGGEAGGGYDDRDDRDAGGYQQQQRAPRERDSRPPRAAAPRDERPAGGDKASRKLERLISLLVEKGVLAPGEIDGLTQSAAAGAPADA
jgi:protein lin-28